MKVGITGGSGFLGTHLTNDLLKNGHTVISFEGNITQFASIDQFFTSTPMDFLVHLAGVSYVPDADNNLQNLFEVNVLGTANVIESLSRRSPKTTLIFASTAQVYDPPLYERIRIAETHRIKPQNVYARSKLMSEKMIETYTSASKLRAIILRIFNHTHKTHPDKFFLPSVYKECLKARAQGEKIVSLSLGNTAVERDICAVQNFTFLVEKLIAKKDHSQDLHTFNVCGGEGFKLEDILMAFGKKLGLDLKIVTDPTKVRPDEPEYIAGDNTVLYKYLGLPHTNTNSISKLIDGFEI